MGFNTKIPTANPNIIISLDAYNSKSYVSGDSTAYDLISDGYNATLTNGVTYDDFTWIFDGTNQYNRLPDNSPIYAPTDNITIEVWVKINVTGSQMGIISCGLSTDPTPANRCGYYLRVNSSGGIAMCVHTDTSKYQYTRNSSILMDTGKFYHVVGIRDGQEMRTYINGVETNGSMNERNAAGTFNSVTEIPDTSGIYYNNARNRAVTFGGEMWDSVSVPNLVQMLDGEIPIIKVYDGVLTTLQIKQNYKALKGRFGL